MAANPAMMVDPWGLDGELSNPLVPNASKGSLPPLMPSYTKPQGFDANMLPHDAGKSQANGRLTLDVKSVQSTTQYTTDDLYDRFEYFTVKALENGQLGFVGKYGNESDALAMAVFDECDSRWTVLLPKYKTSKERDQALGVKRVQSTENLQEVFLGIIFAPIVIAGTAEIAPLAVAAMPSFSLWGGGSATTSVLGGGGSLLAPKVAETLSSPRTQSTVYTVYQVVQNGTVRYVGITANFGRRSAEHLRERGWEAQELLTVAGKQMARGVEQALIELHGLAKNGGTLLNEINSIAKPNPVYPEAVRLGKQILDQHKK